MIASIGLVANLICARILHQCEAESLNIRGAFLHVMGDVVGSLGAILAGLVIFFWQAYWADPAISVLVSFLILYSAWKLVKDAVLVLLEGTPAHVNLMVMKQALCKVTGVDSIHDLHVWTLTSGVHAMTCHAVVVEKTAGVGFWSNSSPSRGNNSTSFTQRFKSNMKIPVPMKRLSVTNTQKHSKRIFSLDAQRI